MYFALKGIRSIFPNLIRLEWTPQATFHGKTDVDRMFGTTHKWYTTAKNNISIGIIDSVESIARIIKDGILRSEHPDHWFIDECELFDEDIPPMAWVIELDQIKSFFCVRAEYDADGNMISLMNHVVPWAHNVPPKAIPFTKIKQVKRKVMTVGARAVPFVGKAEEVDLLLKRTANRKKAFGSKRNQNIAMHINNII